MPQPKRWLDEVIHVLQELGGLAHLSEIYKEIEVRGIMQLSQSWEASIRKTIETYSSDSDHFNKKFDLFYSVEGKGKGVWGLREIISQEEQGNLAELVSGSNEPDIEAFLDDSSEIEVDKILSQLDGDGSIETKLTLLKVRKASKKTIAYLKELYSFTCQICGVGHKDRYGVHIVEAHHIEYFSKTQNHKPSNIVILCPNHHRLVHAGKAKFDKDRCVFIYDNGYEDDLALNRHL